MGGRTPLADMCQPGSHQPVARSGMQHLRPSSISESPPLEAALPFCRSIHTSQGEGAVSGPGQYGCIGGGAAAVAGCLICNVARAMLVLCQYIQSSWCAGGCRVSVGAWGTWMHQRWGRCCSRLPGRCGSARSCSSTALRRLQPPATAPSSRGMTHPFLSPTPPPPWPGAGPPPPVHLPWSSGSSHRYILSQSHLPEA